MNKISDRNKAIGEGVNMLLSLRDHKQFNADGSIPFSYINIFIDYCKTKFDNGLSISKEAITEYDKCRFRKQSFFNTSKEEETPSMFSVSKHTKSYMFADLLFNFIENRKTLV